MPSWSHHSSVEAEDSGGGTRKKCPLYAWNMPFAFTLTVNTFIICKLHAVGDRHHSLCFCAERNRLVLRPCASGRLRCNFRHIWRDRPLLQSEDRVTRAQPFRIVPRPTLLISTLSNARSSGLG